MPKEYLNPKELFPSLQYGFSQIVTSTGGKTVYLSGQVGWDEQQQIVGPGDLRAQTWQTFRNIETAMKALPVQRIRQRLTSAVANKNVLAAGSMDARPARNLMTKSR